jgi:thymidylate kinase
MQKPWLISFSGLDGSGKSTQIEHLGSALRSAGLATHLLAFWDNVVVGVKYRERFVHRVYKSERGIGAPGKPVQRRDKNMRGAHLTLARHFLYLLDALNLRRVLARAEKTGADAIIVDRYIYDELSNLNLSNPFTRIYVRCICAIAPTPDVAYLLDADPALAYERKPEYPPEFMRKCRQDYFALANLLRVFTIIPATGLTEAKAAVLAAAESKMGNPERAGRRRSLCLPKQESPGTGQAA